MDIYSYEYLKNLYEVFVRIRKVTKDCEFVISENEEVLLGLHK